MLGAVLLIVGIIAFLLEIALFMEAAASERPSATEEMGSLLMAIIATAIGLGLLAEYVLL